MPTISIPYGDSEKRFEITKRRLLSVFAHPQIARPAPAQETAAVAAAVAGDEAVDLTSRKAIHRGSP